MKKIKLEDSWEQVKVAVKKNGSWLSSRIVLFAVAQKNF